MGTRVEAQVGPATGRPSVSTAAVYAVISGLAVLTTIGVWLLMLIDENRSIAAATLELAVKFTNVTTLLVAIAAAWIASGRAGGEPRTITHLTAMVMAVVTAVVNATLLDPALPGGWWGVVDLAQHYVIPLAVLISWAMVGPPVDVPRSRLGLAVLVPMAWLVFVLVRGVATGSYPYDFLDVTASGWPQVTATATAILVLMLALGAGAAAIDRHRHGTGSGTIPWRGRLF